MPGCEEMFGRIGGENSGEIVRGLGHWFYTEDPEAVAKLIGAIFEEVIRADQIKPVAVT